MAPGGRSRSLADQIAELEDPTPKDFDPEDIDRQGGQDESASDASDSENEGKGGEFTGREHYEQVGKSKLRGVDDLELGKEYTGKKVSRDALMDEGAHDPFAKGEGESESESESEEGSGDEDEEMGEGESDEEEGEEEESDEGLGSDLEGLQDDASSASGSEQDDEESGSESEDDNDESATESSDDEPATPSSDPNDPRSEIRRLMSKDAQSVAASISAATKADAEKGRAVKRQRLGYDALVGTRLKLQKGWVNMNVLMSKIGGEDEGDEKEDEKKVLDEIDGEEIRKAETAALSLWSTIEGLRGALADAQRQDGKEGNAGEKRKRETPAAPTPDTPLSDIWD
ncbi:rRNA-processing protein bfr2, partial [Ascosphaera atra]